MADGIVTNTIMAAPDTLLGVVKIEFIIHKLAKNTKKEVIIGLVQIRVGNVTSW